MRFAIPKAISPWNVVLHPRLGQLFVVFLAAVYVVRRLKKDTLDVSKFRAKLQSDFQLPADSIARGLNGYNYVFDIYIPLIAEVCLFLIAWYIFHNLVYKQIDNNVRDLKAWGYLVLTIIVLCLGSYIYCYFTRVIQFEYASGSSRGIGVKMVRLHDIILKPALFHDAPGLLMFIVLLEFPARYFSYLSLKIQNSPAKWVKIFCYVQLLLIIVVFSLWMFNVTHYQIQPHGVDAPYHWRNLLGFDFSNRASNGMQYLTCIIGFSILTVGYHNFFLRAILLNNMLYSRRTKVLLLILSIVSLPFGYLFVLNIFPQYEFNSSILEVTGFVTLLLSATTLFFAILTAYVRSIPLLKLRAQLSQKTHELYFLRSQIDPHFLFNSLNTIYSFALEEKSKKTYDAVLKLSDMMRFMLEENTKDKIILAEEVAYLDNYIQLQRMRIYESDETDILIDIQEIPEDAEIYVAPMMLQPFVENAFKHGISSVAPSWIHVKLTYDATRLYFKVSNSLHIDREGSSALKRSGFGLENVRERLKLLYPKRHEVSIKKSDTEYSVSVTLMLS